MPHLPAGAAERHLAERLALALALDAARAARVRRAQVMAGLSLPLAALWLWPGFLSAVAQRAVATAWAFSAVACGAACLAELRLVWRASRGMAAR